jgi:L-rhamnose mutarotase
MPDFMSFSETLVEITGGREPMCSIKEIAQVMRKEPQTIYGYRNGNQPPWQDVVALSEHLIKEYGYYKLGMQTLLIYAYKANNADDLIFELIEAALETQKGLQKKDDTIYKNGLGKLLATIETLKKAV